MIRKAILGTLVLGLPASLALADLTVDTDLGVLGAGAVNLVGDTAGAGNEADYYVNTTNPAGNWGNDYVYQFATTETFLFNLSSNALTGDPDFFLLDSLLTAPDGPKNAAQNDIAAYFLDATPPASGTPYLLAAGTYYVSADSFIGFDGGVVPGDATFDVTLSLDTIMTPTATDLGVLANEGEAFTIDSFGSDFDTELALFDSDSLLLSTNDDAGGVLQSELDLASGLAAGQYYVALGGFNSIFGDGFSATGGSSSGDYTLNYPGGSSDGTLAADTIAWFSFTVVPEPGSLLLLGLAGAALARRSR